MACPINYEENKWGYLRSLSQEELKTVYEACLEDIRLYNAAPEKEQNSLEGDRDRAKHIIDFIDKNQLIKKKQL